MIFVYVFRAIFRDYSGSVCKQLVLYSTRIFIFYSSSSLLFVSNQASQEEG